MTRLQKLLKLLEKNPSDSFTRYAIALEHRSAGSLQKAVDLLGRLMQDDPDYLAAYYQLGKLYQELNDPETAKTVFEKGLEGARAAGDQHTADELLEAIEELQDDF